MAPATPVATPKPVANGFLRPARARGGAGFAFGYATLLFFLFLLYSRICDLVLPGLHIPLIASTLSCIFAVLSGSLLTGFSEPVSKFFLGYTIWLTVTIPFSVWKGGSFQTVTSDWYKAVLAYFLVVSLAQTLDEGMRAVRVVTYALGLLAILSLVFGHQIEGRLQMSQGYFSNPNELGMAALAGVFLWWVIAQGGARNRAIRAVAFIMIPLLLWIVLRTGSRSGLLCILVFIPFVFREYSPAGRVKFLVVVGVILLGSVVALPGLLVHRLGTIFSANSTSETAVEDEEAIGSSNQRMYLLRTSLWMTAKNPLFGVGPGNFAVVDADETHSRHEHASWVGTHNTYTQISSEAGIPAAILFIGTLVASWRGLRRVRRLNRQANHPRKQEIDLLCAGLQFTLALFIVQFFFIHMAYSAIYPAIAGLMVVVKRAVERELAAQPVKAPAPSPIVAGGPSIPSFAFPRPTA
jgi:O-antigen ligase